MRRVEAAKLNLDRGYKEFSELEAFVYEKGSEGLQRDLAEFVENCERLGLDWKDTVHAIAAIHDKLSLSIGKDWTLTLTADILSLSKGYVSEALTAVEALRVCPECEGAKTRRDAIALFKKAAERANRAEQAKRVPRLGDIFDSGEVGEKEEKGETSTLEVEQMAPLLFHGSCTDVIPRLIEKGIRADLILTDPPYAIDHAGRGAVKQFYDDGAKAAKEQLLETIPLFDALLKPDGFVCVFCSFEQASAGSELREALAKSFLLLDHAIIWDKEQLQKGRPFDLWPNASYESILFARRGNKRLSETMLSVKRVPPVPLQGRFHTNEKPQDLLRWLILGLTVEGELVIDPYSGGFSTCEAAASVRRWSIGIEKKKEFVDSGLLRLREYEGSLFELEEDEDAMHKQF